MSIASRFPLAGLALCAGVLAVMPAQAVTLTEPVFPAPFADTALTGTTVAARPELAGLVLADDLTPFSFSGVTGTVQNRVVRETGAGTLDFYWKVNVDASPTGASMGVGAFRLADFGYSNLKDADWRIDGLGTVAPTTARLFNSTSYPAGDINFLFGSAVTAGSDSRFFFLHTSATSFAKTAKFDMLTAGSEQLSSSMSTYAPAVPEPESLALTIAGVAVVAGLTRRRRAV